MLITADHAEDWACTAVRAYKQIGEILKPFTSGLLNTMATVKKETNEILSTVKKEAEEIPKPLTAEKADSTIVGKSNDGMTTRCVCA